MKVLLGKKELEEAQNIKEKVNCLSDELRLSLGE